MEVYGVTECWSMVGMLTSELTHSVTFCPQAGCQHEALHSNRCVQDGGTAGGGRGNCCPTQGGQRPASQGQDNLQKDTLVCWQSTDESAKSEVHTYYIHTMYVCIVCVYYICM